MWESLNTELIAGIIALIGIAALVLKHFDLIQFGKQETSQESCPDGSCRDAIYTALRGKLDSDAETGGAQHISREALGKFALYRPEKLQDAVCAKNMAELINQMRETVDARVGEAENRIIKAVRNGGRE